MASVNREQISRVAAFLKANPPKGSGMNFYSVQTSKGELVLDRMYPRLGHPGAVDFFFLACLHQYGFWYGDADGYLEPMFGNVGEKNLKGSDLLWQVLLRSLHERPELWEPGRLAELRPAELQQMLSDDEGTQWPDFDVRLALTRSYGRWLMNYGRTPVGVVAEANVGGRPLEAFLRILRLESPFGDDVLLKKALLLAMALANRPEKFLKVSPDDRWEPIVDYHLMRVALRLGLVDLTAQEADANARRAWIPGLEETMTRIEVRSAVGDLIRESGLSMAQVDETLWMARKYCPEMESPDCDKCLFGPVCAKRTHLFQPVLRTTAY